MLILRFCNQYNHGAELNDVGNEKIDDIDRGNLVISDLREKGKGSVLVNIWDQRIHCKCPGARYRRTPLHGF